MAKTSKRKTKPGAAAQSADPVDALMRLVAERGWQAATLAAVAAEADMPLAALYPQYSSKLALLEAYARRIDTAMLKAVGPLVGTGDAKDRLFEVIMARLDAMAPEKAALKVLGRELPADPAAAVCFAAGALRRSLDWMLGAAGLDAPGLRGLLRRKVLGAVCLDTLRVWVGDDGADMAKTMAHLDKRLGQAMPLLTGGSFFSRLREKKA